MWLIDNHYRQSIRAGRTQVSALHGVEIVNLDLAMQNFPALVTAPQLISVGGPDNLANVFAGQGAHAIDVAHGAGLVRPLEAYDLVGGQVMALAPGGPQHLVDCRVDAFVTLEGSERWANIPGAVRPRSFHRRSV